MKNITIPESEYLDLKNKTKLLENKTFSKVFKIFNDKNFLEKITFLQSVFNNFEEKAQNNIFLNQEKQFSKS